MAALTILTICLGVTVLALSLKMRNLKRDVYEFEDHLEAYLDDMLSGKEPEYWDDNRDTLWSRLYEKMQRLQSVWRTKTMENRTERKKLQTLISDISHQTKTPIANMKMYGELLSGQDELSEKERKFLENIQGQTEKLNFLMESMVKMSRLETGMIKIHKKNGSLYETLGQAIAAAVPKAEQKRIAIYVDCDETIEISHDQKWTEEAIGNVLDNGIKYTEPGGAIHISVCSGEIFTKISIADTGKGIALERQGEIFNRFYREPEVHSTEGIGVGFYLTREILTLQNGYIKVQSDVGKGADFGLFLPNEQVEVSQFCENLKL